MPKILVTGGCGYIGSHTIIDLLDNNFEVVSVDNLVNSSAAVLDQVHKITGVQVQNYAVDLCDRTATNRIFEDHPDLTGVIHFAALKSVGDSMEQPLVYYRNNLNSLLNILEACQLYKVKHFIFSSSCSIYGNATTLPVTESTPQQEAESVYAATKQMGERIIRDLMEVFDGGKAILLRYFNPAGAHESGLLGEAPSNKASNLVPVITETAIGKRKELVVFGEDYHTRDGSCVRDYIHIMDLAEAHTKALQYLLEDRNETNCEIYNLGIGAGVTVLEVIHAFEQSTGQSLNYRIGPRRPGDVEAIYANYDKAKARFGWSPKRTIEDIMRTAWQWEQRRSGRLI